MKTIKWYLHAPRKYGAYKETFKRFADLKKYVKDNNIYYGFAERQEHSNGLYKVLSEYEIEKQKFVKR